MRCLLVSISAFALVVACDKSDNPEPDAGLFQELIVASWSADPGQEPYRCARLTMTEDVYVAGFRSIDPLGTHHAVVSVDSTPSGPDGEFDCSESALGHNMIFASGVGTEDYVFPPGVAVKIPAGSQLNLNLHVFNATDNTLSGSSGTAAMIVPASEVDHEAEMIFAGTFGINIPANDPMMPDNTVSVSGGCSLSNDATYLSVWPHMHQIGVHMKVEHTRNAQTTVLHDGPYTFNEQVGYPLAPLLSALVGDDILVTCTYKNNTGNTVTFGDSSLDEMCFAGLYRYPATGANLFSCAN